MSIQCRKFIYVRECGSCLDITSDPNLSMNFKRHIYEITFNMFLRVNIYKVAQKHVEKIFGKRCV